MTKLDEDNIYQLIKQYTKLYELNDTMLCLFHYPNYEPHNILHVYLYNSEKDGI